MTDGRATPAPLCGVLFVIGVVVAMLIVGDPPDADEPAEELVAFYGDKEGALFGSAALQAWAGVLLVIFAAAARRRFEAPGAGMAGALTMGGAVVAATGLMVDSIVRGGLAEAGDDGAAQVVQTLHYVTEVTFFPIAGGLALLMFGLGAAILTTGYLPRPVAYVAIAGGILTLSPAFFIGLPLSALVLLASSVVLARPAPTAPAPPPEAAAG